MKDRVLIVMVGLPYSGKSTWARATKHPIVSPDAIRLAMGHRFYANLEELVWALAKLMVRSLFEAGHEIVIVDGCHTTQKRRDSWKGDWGLEFEYVATGVDECRRRATKAGDTEILPVISRMAGEMDLEGKTS